jgi:hypothetical protein
MLMDLDPKSARLWLELAAQGGEADAMGRLAVLLDPYDL